MVQFAQDLCAVLHFSMKPLAKRIVSPQLRSQVAELVKHERRRDLLRLYFRQHNLLSPEIEEALAVQKEVNDLRKISAHTVARAERDKNYFELQADLVDRLQCGLREMMLAFAVAEKGSSDAIRKSILDYKIVVY